MHVHDSLNLSSIVFLITYLLIFFRILPISYTRSQRNQNQSEPWFQLLGCNDAITSQSLKGLHSNALGWISGAFIYLWLTVSRSGKKGAAADWSLFSKGLNMWSNVKSVCQKKRKSGTEGKEREGEKQKNVIAFSQTPRTCFSLWNDMGRCTIIWT